MHNVRSALGGLSSQLFLLLSHVAEDHHLAEELKAVHGTVKDLSERLEEEALHEALAILDRIGGFAGWAQIHQLHAGHSEHHAYFAMHLSHAVTEAGEVRQLVLTMQSVKATRR